MDRFADVELDRPRRLRLTVSALREVKRRAGLPLSQLLLNVGLLDFDAIVWLIWAAIKGGGEKKFNDTAAERAVQEYLDNGNTVEDLVGIIEDVAERSGLLPKAADDDDQEEDPTTAPETAPTLELSTTGSTSSTPADSESSPSDPGSSTG